MAVLVYIMFGVIAIALRDFIKGEPPCKIYQNMKLVDCSGTGLTSVEGLNLPSNTDGFTLDISENHLSNLPASYIGMFVQIDLRNNIACNSKVYKTFKNVLCDSDDAKTGLSQVDYTTQSPQNTPIPEMLPQVHTSVTFSYKDVIITISSASQILIAIASSIGFIIYIRSKFAYIRTQLETLYNIYRRQFATDFEGDNPGDQAELALAAPQRIRVQVPRHVRRQQPPRAARGDRVDAPVAAAQQPPQRPPPPPPQQDGSIAGRVRAKKQVQRRN